MNKKIIIGIATAIVILFAGMAYFMKPNSGINLYLPNPKNMKITSPAFRFGEYIPKKYSCQGENINPPLELSDVPAEAKGLVIIVDDPDAPMGMWTHWTLWNINPKTVVIGENGIPRDAVSGINSSGNNKYDGPCPPGGTHRYFFKLYALDTKLDLNASSNKTDLEKALSGHILDWSELMGLYKK